LVVTLDKEIRAQLAKEVRLEDLQDAHLATLQAINAIGVDAFVELSHATGGISIYVPKFESVIAAARNRVIIREFDRGNYAELAIKYGITEVWVRQIINQQRIKENSISLFDDPAAQSG
jgi:Mor family transcriptional regulator